MIEIKPKVRLTEEYVKLINRWYNTKISEKKLLNYPCFSQPDLSSHACNVFARLPGDHECDHCEHVPYRLCHVMCYIHHFCLAAFAARLNLQNIEGASMEKIIINILKKWKYPTLNRRVVRTLDLLSEAKQPVPDLLGEEQEEGDKKMPELSESLPEELRKKLPKQSEIVQDVQEKPAVIIPPLPSSLIYSDTEVETTILSSAPKKVEIEEEFYTIAETADLLECSVASIQKYISVGCPTKSGTMAKLETKKEGRRHLISKSSIVEFEAAGVKRRKRKKS